MVLIRCAQGTLLVAQFTEKYVGEVCLGVIEDIAVPSPESIDPLLAPYLPPYAAQVQSQPSSHPHSCPIGSC